MSVGGKRERVRGYRWQRDWVRKRESKENSFRVTDVANELNDQQCVHTFWHTWSRDRRERQIGQTPYTNAFEFNIGTRKPGRPQRRPCTVNWQFGADSARLFAVSTGCLFPAVFYWTNQCWHVAELIWSLIFLNLAYLSLSLFLGQLTASGPERRHILSETMCLWTCTIYSHPYLRVPTISSFNEKWLWIMCFISAQYGYKHYLAEQEEEEEEEEMALSI